VSPGLVLGAVHRIPSAALTNPVSETRR